MLCPKCGGRAVGSGAGRVLCRDCGKTSNGPEREARAQRNMKAIVFHEEHGEVARHTVNARMFA